MGLRYLAMAPEIGLWPSPLVTQRWIYFVEVADACPEPERDYYLPPVEN